MLSTIRLSRIRGKWIDQVSIGQEGILFFLEKATLAICRTTFGLLECILFIYVTISLDYRALGSKCFFIYLPFEREELATLSHLLSNMGIIWQGLYFPSAILISQLGSKRQGIACIGWAQGISLNNPIRRFT